MADHIAAGVIRNLAGYPAITQDPMPRIELYSQFRGARVLSHFYPKHWARVQLARDTARRYGDPS